jgi:hypothetical protein
MTAAVNIPASKTKSRRIFVWLVATALIAVSIANLYFASVQYSSPLQYVDGILNWVVAPIVFTVVAALILQRHAGHRIGWLLMLVIGGMAVPPFLDHFFLAQILTASSLTPQQLIYALFSTFSWWLLLAPIFLIFLLYPTGELPSPRWRIAVYLLLATFTFDVVVFALSPTLGVGGSEYQIPNPLAAFSQEQAELFLPIFALGLGATSILTFASVFVRYRSAQDVERAQMRWLFAAAALFFFVYFLNLTLRWDAQEDTLLSALFSVSFIGIPVAIGIGVMRYRLWDIDVVINRSLVFGLLTGILAALFAGITALVGQLTRGMVGEDGVQIAAVVAAIVVAGVFQPLRTGLENAINRRLFPENVDLGEGLGELSPEMWPFLSLDEVLNASLEHLQDIYDFDRAAIFIVSDSMTLKPQAAWGVSGKDLSAHTLTASEQTAFAQKKGSIDNSTVTEFPVSVPVYWQRRKSQQLLGVLRLGKRAQGRGYTVDELKALHSFGGKLGRAVYALDKSQRLKRKL